jgi:hypothetical protein
MGLKKTYLKYFPKTISNESIAFFFITLIVCSGMFFNKMLPFYWMIFPIVEVIYFFYFTNQLSKKWINYSDKKFKKKLLTTAIVIRVLYVILSYYFYLEMTGQPFEFGAADSWDYHVRALEYSGLDWDVLKYHLQNMLSNELSDSGYVFYLTFIYSIVGPSIIIARIINALFSAFTCLLIYNLAKRNFGESVARMSAIMAMLLPNLIFYCGLHLKEPLMVFLCVAFVERADVLIRGNKIDVKQFILPVIIGILLFTLRTVLGITAFLSLFTALTFSKSTLSGWSKRLLIATWLLTVFIFLFAGSIKNEVDQVIAEKDTSQQLSMDFRSNREGGNKFAKYGTAAIFAPMVFAVPFPTFVYVENQENQILISGGNYVRNAYAFFVMLALFILIKQKLYRNNLLIISFLLGYLAIVVQSPFALSERFHQPAVPFLLILAAFGIVNMTPKQKKLFIPYLFLILVVIVGWSWFKLAGRGMAE